MSLLEVPMFAEHPAPDSPAPDSPAPDSIDEPVDVIVLVAPDRADLSSQFVDTLSEMKARGSAAVLVVFPRVVDAEILQRATDAGATHCVVAPSSGELFAHIERARSLRRYAAAEDDRLDTFWRTRSHRQ
ncbi:MAG: hypothetical protein M3Q30_03785 [Actinomycetota bacterium]|nr:hypothetical protein [Actinomycetota bacterium]